MPVLDELCDHCERPAVILEAGKPLCDDHKSTRQSRFDEKKFSDFDPEEGFGPAAPVREIPVTDAIVKAIPIPGQKVDETMARAAAQLKQVQPAKEVIVKTGYEVVPNLCVRGCGQPLHRGRCRGSQLSKCLDETIIRRGMEIKVERSVEHRASRTQKETITVSQSAHRVNRMVAVIIPDAQPVTQVALTPEIANAVWASLTKEQRYDLLDIDDCWNNGYDADTRMAVISKVLLVHPETA